MSSKSVVLPFQTNQDDVVTMRLLVHPSQALLAILNALLGHMVRQPHHTGRPILMQYV